jgi:hypothetical protein
MSDSLAAVGDTWERLARVDALWAVLSEPDKQGNRWDLDDFLRTGEEEISALLADLAVFGPVPTGSALDFGCGVGGCHCLCRRASSGSRASTSRRR